MKSFLSFSILFLCVGSVVSAEQSQPTTAEQSQPTIADIPYQDEKFDCITASAAQRYTKDFGIDEKSFGGRELCKPTSDFKRLMNDLILIENGQFGTQSGNETLIKGFIKPDRYYTWMKSQTRGMERGNDVPYATAYNSGGYFTMQDGWSTLSSLGRVGTVIHEARHTAGYVHIACQQGPYQGSGLSGCDGNYMYGGSHAVEMEYYAYVSVKGKNFHPVYKKMARLMAIGRANFVFNTPVIKKKETLLALSNDQKTAFIYLDDSTGHAQWIKKEVPQLPSTDQVFLKRTSFGAALFNTKKVYAIDPYQNSGFADLVEDVYSYLKILVEFPAAVKDLEEYDLGLKRYLTRISDKDVITSWDFPKGTWGKDFQLPFSVEKTVTTLPDEKQPSGYYIISKTGEISQYQPQTNKLVRLSTMWDFSNKRAAKVTFASGMKTLLLKNDGEIKVLQNGQESVWSESHSLGPILDMTEIPLYDGFDVVVE